MVRWWCGWKQREEKQAQEPYQAIANKAKQETYQHIQERKKQEGSKESKGTIFIHHD